MVRPTAPAASLAGLRRLSDVISLPPLDAARRALNALVPFTVTAVAHV
jgi:hypothetical protein